MRLGESSFMRIKVRMRGEGSMSGRVIEKFVRKRKISRQIEILEKTEKSKNEKPKF